MWSTLRLSEMSPTLAFSAVTVSSVHFANASTLGLG